MKKNNILIIILIVLLIIFGIYCIFSDKNKKSESYVQANSNSDGDDFELVNQADENVLNDGDVQFIDNNDDSQDGSQDGSQDDGIQYIGKPPPSDSFEIGFGMGPGLYGSGRHTSNMVGN